MPKEGPTMPTCLREIEFQVAGVPRGQPRPRAVAFAGRARMYDDPKHPVRTWRELIALEAQKHRPEQPMEGPVFLHMTFSPPRPKSHYTKKGLRDDAPAWCDKKPDLDNLAKAVMDVLTECRYWNDDGQVCSAVIEKCYRKDEWTGVIVELKGRG